MAYLQAINLKKTFKNVTIDFSFEAEKQSFTAIVGKSGSGKSTILRLISGLEKSEGGKLFVDGNDIINFPCKDRNCTMVFQSSALFLNMTVEDNIMYGLRSMGISKKIAKQKAENYLKKFNLEGFEKRKPETLSGGEAQRVALARSLIVNPKLLLLDEPFSALDAPLRKKLANDIALLQKEYKFTAIMVTHDIQEARFLADKIIFVSKGKNVWHGNASDFDESLFDYLQK